MGVEVTNCCGFSLKHGTIIIGVIQSIFAFMVMILCSAYAEHPHELVQMSDPSVIPELTTLRAILITCAVVSALQCVFSILLIFAAETNHPTLLMPWLILNPVALFVYIVGTLVTIIHHTGVNNASYIMAHIAFSTLISLIVIYQILTVYSLKQHLKRLNF
ncbi:uncharacterized protein LOC115874570 [Sitophilus oryzae]|uniref:Uncharacterized protein LOC115874570 n=1 Tax=Sitophilus oryzae TaxID=7048 RepID=A0A6J2X336_SITOR|nr:uncharacterized protein LOC115874570 [Sitophilus oryzae]XP_030745623.1 uncharacterized protein LOC115874570 [Sitophilus oryzae]